MKTGDLVFIKSLGTFGRVLETYQGGRYAWADLEPKRPYQVAIDADGVTVIKDDKEGRK